MDKIVRPFEYEGRQVRTVIIDGEPWFVVRDACDILEIDQPVRAVERLDPDEVSSTHVTDALGRQQETYIVNEPGLYALVLGSRKPEAKLFKRWVTHEVIPSIRKTGAYVAPAAPVSLEDLIILQAQSVKELKAKVALIEEKTIAAHHRIDSLDTTNIEGTLRQRLEKMVKRYAWANGIYHSVAWHHFDQAYNTAFHTNLTALRQNHCKRHGLKDITRPEYLEAAGRLEDAIRVADKMLNDHAAALA